MNRPGRPSTPRMPLRGVLLLATGRGAEGMAEFEPTLRAFWVSLVPLFALPVLRATAAFTQGDMETAVTVLLLMIVGDVGPLVASHWFAIRWQRGPQWLHYAVALNWCQGALLLAGSTGLALLAGTGSGIAVLRVAILALLVYAIWLNWVVTKFGLGLSNGRAVLMMLGVAGIVSVLMAVPLLADYAVNGPPPGLAASTDAGGAPASVPGPSPNSNTPGR